MNSKNKNKKLINKITMLNKKIFKFQTLSKIFASIMLIGLISLYPVQLVQAVAGSVAGNQGQIPDYVGKSATRVELLKFTITQGNPVNLDTLDSVKVTMLGNAGAVATDGVLLILDDGATSGKIDGTDTQVSNASISGGYATLNLASNYADDIGAVAADGTLTYFIAVNTSASAVTGNTIDARIDISNMTFNALGAPVYHPTESALGGSEYITLDVTSPTISARETDDTDDDGYIDRIVMTIADNANAKLDDDFSGLAITVAGASGITYDTGDTANDNIFWVNFTDGVLDTGSTALVTIGTSTSLSDYYNNDYYNIDLGNNIATDAGVAATDKARPILMSIANYDVDTAADGKNDEIYLTFSEPITDSSVDVGDIKIDGNADGSYETDGTLEATSSTNHSQTDETNDKYLTIKSTALTGTAKVGIQVQEDAITDAATSPNNSGAVQAIAHDAGSGNTDKSKPVILTAETGDQDSNGLIDNYKLTFSEAIEGTTLTVGGANGFAITNFGAAGGASEQLDAAADGTNISTSSDYTILYLTFSEDTGDNRYTNGGTAVKPTIAYTDDNISGVTDY